MTPNINSVGCGSTLVGRDGGKIQDKVGFVLLSLGQHLDRLTFRTWTLVGSTNLDGYAKKADHANTDGLQYLSLSPALGLGSITENASKLTSGWSVEEAYDNSYSSEHCCHNAEDN